MSFAVQDVFNAFYPSYLNVYGKNGAYDKVARDIMGCKTGALGCNVTVCKDCGHSAFHANSCRNRNCPNCQAMPRALWVDARKSEVVDSPYFHVVFTVPRELNALFFANQKTLYSLLHKSAAQTILELSADDRFLGAKPGIIQVLHTWGQKLDYHPHIHCIVTGGGLNPFNFFKSARSGFFIPVHVLSRKFRGKFMAFLKNEHRSGGLSFSGSLLHLRNGCAWSAYVDSLYRKEWIPFIRETFNGQGNAIDYLGRYTHRIAISNSRIINVAGADVTFKAKDYRLNRDVVVSLAGVEFVRRFLMHVLPKGFVKIRYFGFLSNQVKVRCLLAIRLQSRNLKSRESLAGLKVGALLLRLYGLDILSCPICNSKNIVSSVSFRRRC